MADGNPSIETGQTPATKESHDQTLPETRQVASRLDEVYRAPLDVLNYWRSLGALQPPSRENMENFGESMKEMIKQFDFLPTNESSTEASTANISKETLAKIGESYARLLGYASTQEWKKAVESGAADNPSESSTPTEGIYQGHDVPTPFFSNRKL